MKIVAVVFIAVLGIAFQVQANGLGNKACRIMFGDEARYLPKKEQIQTHIKAFVIDATFELQALYDLKGRVQLNQDFNWVVGHIIEANNTILRVAAELRDEKGHFSSRSEREKYSELMAGLKSLFQKQRFSPEQIEFVFESHFAVVDLQKQETVPVNSSIGFVNFAEAKRNVKAEQVRRIGFVGVVAEKYPYGRVKEKELALSDVKAPIGFVHSDSAADLKPASRLTSIGFTQPVEVVDVGYRMNMKYNVRSGQFEIEDSARPAIGFVTQQ